MKNPTILIVAGDEILRQDLKGRLLPHGFEVIEAPCKGKLRQYFQNSKPNLILIGANKKIDDRLKEAKQIHQWNSDIPVILITKYSSEERAIAALRAGINDYFKWPMADEELVAGIYRNIPDHKAYLQETHIDNPMIGNSDPMLEIKAFLPKVAATDSTVLITGETGTGKELAAEFIHNNGSRHKKPFICVNCAALPENLVESELFGYDRGAFTGAIAAKPGKFIMAEGGSVFLDEIGDMSPFAQAKILRTIEGKEIYPLGGKGAIPLDIRVIAATNKDPEGLVVEGKFREDLYYRLNVARIHLPPLRERKEDISRLIAYTIEKMNLRFNRNVKGLTDETMAMLFRYDWPGNIRELMNLIEAMFINLPSRHIDLMDLPKRLRQRLKISEGVSRDERKLLLSALLETKWNKSKAAQKLHWSRTTIYRKISEYHIVEKRNPER